MTMNSIKITFEVLLSPWPHSDGRIKANFDPAPAPGLSSCGGWAPSSQMNNDSVFQVFTVRTFWKNKFTYFNSNKSQAVEMQTIYSREIALCSLVERAQNLLRADFKMWIWFHCKDGAAEPQPTNTHMGPQQQDTVRLGALGPAALTHTPHWDPILHLFPLLTLPMF